MWQSLARISPGPLANRLKSRVPPGVGTMTLVWGGRTITFDRLDSSTAFRAMFWGDEPCAEDDLNSLVCILAQDAKIIFDIGS